MWKNYINLNVISSFDYEHIQLDKKITENVIIKDIDRTFPEHNYFNKEKFGYYGQFSLMRVLGKFATAYPEISYCQGMNFIVGLLLMVSGGNEVESFCMLDAILYQFNIKEFFTENMPELKRFLVEFDSIFQSNCRLLYMHFMKNEISEDM